MTVHAPLTMTKEAFLAWVERREVRHELSAGRVFKPPRINLRHAIVTGNLTLALRSRLSIDQYDLTGASFAVHIDDNVRFPDLMIEPAQEDGQSRKAEAPILIAEVLSPGTLHIDFGEKKREYLSLPTLQAYLVLSPDEPRAWLWQRTDGAFPPEPEIVEGMDKNLVLPALGIDIPLTEIYRGVR